MERIVYAASAALAGDGPLPPVRLMLLCLKHHALPFCWQVLKGRRFF